MENFIKKAVIKVAHKWTRDETAHIYSLENGYVFAGKYYKELDDMKDDIIIALKKHFDIK